MLFWQFSIVNASLTPPIETWKLGSAGFWLVKKPAYFSYYDAMKAVQNKSPALIKFSLKVNTIDMTINGVVWSGFELTKKNNCDGDIFEHSFRL